MYPNLAIANRVYPLHLTDRFCDIYLDVYNQRKSFKKGTPENAMLKLALNGVYGDSNNKFGPFYDPGYTMAITINGQLSLLLLAEKLLKIEGLKIVQVNTDGITVACPKELRWKYDRVCADWQKQVGLELEFADYEKMYIRDVNNYIAIYTNGKVKRKGVYQYEDLEWHKNQGGLVIQKAAEAAMLYGKDIEEFVRNHTDVYDFMLRTKIPKNYRLVMRYTAKNDDGTVETTDFLQQNVCRYYVKNYGGSLMKLMPPLKKKVELGEGEDRENFIEKGFATKVCNNMDDFDGEINYDYYIREAKKLIVPKIEGLDTDSDQEQNDDSDDNE